MTGFQPFIEHVGYKHMKLTVPSPVNIVRTCCSWVLVWAGTSSVFLILLSTKFSFCHREHPPGEFLWGKASILHKTVAKFSVNFHNVA